jgi:hypothetical protein
MRSIKVKTRKRQAYNERRFIVVVEHNNSEEDTASVSVMIVAGKLEFTRSLVMRNNTGLSNQSLIDLVKSVYDLNILVEED